jgi:RNA recognition motif-containing protein
LEILPPEQPDKENKLFVGMIPKSFQEHDLYNLFIGFGELREVSRAIPLATGHTFS